MPLEDVKSPNETPTGRNVSSAWYVATGFLVLVLLVAMLLPAVQQVGSRPIPQVYRNMRQIVIALATYEAKHGAFPHDPRGAEYALYRLSAELPASVFDGYPRRQPRAEARWDHTQGRLEQSDFEYLNPPRLQGSPSHWVLLAEKPQEEYDSVILMTGDSGRPSCRTPEKTSKDLLGNWETSDQFLIKDEVLYREWESVPLPQGRMSSHGNSWVADGSIWNTRDTQHDYGRVQIDFEYKNGELVKRTFRSPEGTITDQVTTDALGRIVAFEREPANWKDFWPVREEVP